MGNCQAYPDQQSIGAHTPTKVSSLQKAHKASPQQGSSLDLAAHVFFKLKDEFYQQVSKQKQQITFKLSYGDQTSTWFENCAPGLHRSSPVDLVYNLGSPDQTITLEISTQQQYVHRLKFDMHNVLRKTMLNGAKPIKAAQNVYSQRKFIDVMLKCAPIKSDFCRIKFQSKLTLEPTQAQASTPVIRLSELSMGRAQPFITFTEQPG